MIRDVDLGAGTDEELRELLQAAEVCVVGGSVDEAKLTSLIVGLGEHLADEPGAMHIAGDVFDGDVVAVLSLHVCDGARMPGGSNPVPDGGAAMLHVWIQHDDVESFARERPGGGEPGNRRSKYHHVMDHGAHSTRTR